MTNKKQVCVLAILLVVGVLIWGAAGATADPAESFTVHPLREVNLFLGRPLVCFSALGLLVLLIAKPLPETVRKGSFLVALGMLAVYAVFLLLYWVGIEWSVVAFLITYPWIFGVGGILLALGWKK